MVLSVVTDPVENLSLTEHYLPFRYDRIQTGTYVKRENDSSNTSGLCIQYKAPETSQFSEYIGTANFIL